MIRYLTWASEPDMVEESLAISTLYGKVTRAKMSGDEVAAQKLKEEADLRASAFIKRIRAWEKAQIQKEQVLYYVKTV